MFYNDDDFFMISGIQHFVFCRRQWAMIHVENIWNDNILTVQGQNLHKKADNPFKDEKRNNIITVMAMPVKSQTLGIYGKCDIVEFYENEDVGVYLPKYAKTYTVVPVEYKHGSLKKDDSDVLQLLAEAVCLEEMLATKIDYGYIYYAKKRRREKIVFSSELRDKLERCINEMHDYMKKGYTPKVKEQRKCKSCSLYNLCFPDLFDKEQVSTYLQRRLWEQ